MADTTTTTLKPLTRDAFVNFRPRTKTVDLPDYGLTATVRELRTSESVQFDKLQKESPEQATFYLVRTAVLAPDGGPLFQDGDAIDGLPLEAVTTLATAIATLSFPQPAGATKPPPSTPAGDSGETAVG